jgi:hypothetical protein
VAQSRNQATVVLRTSVTAIAPDGRAIVTATVRPGSLVPPGGKVKFIDETNHRALGSSLLKSRSGGPCTPSDRSCRARLSVRGSRLAKGANRIIGLFDPQRLYFPSFRGGTWLYRGVRPTCHAVSPSTLPVFTAAPIAYAAAHHNTLCKGRVRFNGADVIVYSRNRVVVTRNTVVATGTQKLPCGTRSGSLLAFSISGSQAPGALAFQVYGHAATLAHEAHPHGYVCYESTIPFRTASGARAKHTADGQYYGSLPHCRDDDGDDTYPIHMNGDDQQIHPAPCIEWQQYAVKHRVASWTTWIQPTTGDPRLHTY